MAIGQLGLGQGRLGALGGAGKPHTLTGLTADNTSVTADTTEITADMTMFFRGDYSGLMGADTTILISDYAR